MPLTGRIYWRFCLSHRSAEFPIRAAPACQDAAAGVRTRAAGLLRILNQHRPPPSREDAQTGPGKIFQWKAGREIWQKKWPVAVCVTDCQVILHLHRIGTKSGMQHLPTRDRSIHRGSSSSGFCLGGLKS